MLDYVRFAWVIAIGLVLAALLLYLGWLGLRALRRWAERRQHARECEAKQRAYTEHRIKHLEERLGCGFGVIRIGYAGGRMVSEPDHSIEGRLQRLDREHGRLCQKHVGRSKELESRLAQLVQEVERRTKVGDAFMAHVEKSLTTLFDRTAPLCSGSAGVQLDPPKPLVQSAQVELSPELKAELDMFKAKADELIAKSNELRERRTRRTARSSR